MDESKPNGTSESRRQVLKLLAVAPLAGCVTEPEPEAPPADEEEIPGAPTPLVGEVAVGSVDDFNTEALLAIAGERVAVGRDGDGLWALSLRCGHLGCTIGEGEGVGQLDFAGIRCGCHGSEYGRDGDLRRGPSEQDLDNLALRIEADGTVVIDRDTTVPLGSRTLPVA